jgi:predicted enzyme related to lactoylglutathione lyase
VPPSEVTGISPQFLVDDLDRAVAYYRDKLGFELDFTYESFYASVSRDGFAIHLKHGHVPAEERKRRREDEHLDAYVAVEGVGALFEELETRGAQVIQPLTQQPWSCLDFIVQDADGYILCFSELQDEDDE